MSAEQPQASSPAALKRMRNTRRSGTVPELSLRRELDKRRLRYLVDTRAVPEISRRADIVFPKVRVAVFVDGCFWHMCPEHASWPQENAEWWRSKLEQNRRRDLDTNARLRKAGWIVIRSWAHEDAATVADRIDRTVASARQQPA